MSTFEDIPTYGKHPKSSPPFHRTVPRSSPFLRTCVVRTTTMMKLTEYPFNREIRGVIERNSDQLISQNVFIN